MATTPTAATPKPATAATAKPATVASAVAHVRGNRKTMVYHRPDCPSYNSVTEKNRIEFNNEAAAQAQSYRIAKNCQKAG